MINILLLQRIGCACRIDDVILCLAVVAWPANSTANLTGKSLSVPSFIHALITTCFETSSLCIFLHSFPVFFFSILLFIFPFPLSVQTCPLTWLSCWLCTSRVTSPTNPSLPPTPLSTDLASWPSFVVSSSTPHQRPSNRVLRGCYSKNSWNDFDP